MKGNHSKTVNPSWIVYIVGISLFGLYYEKMKFTLGGDLHFIGAAIMYLLALRLIGDFVARKWRVRK